MTDSLSALSPLDGRYLVFLARARDVAFLPELNAQEIGKLRDLTVPHKLSQ